MTKLVFDSQLMSTLMSCGRLTDNRFNKQLQGIGGKANSLECGSIFHAWAEFFYKALKDGKNRNDAIDAGFKAAKLYIHGCEPCKNNICQIHKGQDYTGVTNTPELPEKNRTSWMVVLKTIMEYVDFYQNDSFKVIDVEHVRGAIIYEDSDIQVLWKAKFDLIVETNQIAPWDHKTSGQRRPSLSLNNQFMGQVVLCEGHNMVVNKVGFQTSLKPSEKFERVMMSYSSSRLEEWRKEIVPYWAYKYIEYNKTGYWPPNFTHCENKYSVCMFKEACETDKSLREQTLKLNFVKGKVWDIRND